MSENPSTRERILDAAEELFAERGSGDVSVRRIAAAAGVELGTLTYHFKKKEHLFDELVRRRALALAEDTNGRLREVLNAGQSGREMLEPLIAALVEPLIDRLHARGPGWRNYMRMISSMVNVSDSEDFYVSEVYLYHRETIDLFLEGLRRINPEYDAEAVYCFYLFLCGAVLHILQGAGSINIASHGEMRGDDYTAIMKHLAKFYAAGFMEISK